jgi:Glyoxalase-like domain
MSANRREFFGYGLATAALLVNPARGFAAPASGGSSSVDHLILGVPDLDQGTAWIEAQTGVKPAIGGRHPGRGTRNALLSLGHRRYLETIAPDPEQSVYDFVVDLRKLTRPTLVNWAAATSIIGQTADQLRQHGEKFDGPRAGSRTRPDGRVLHWKTLIVNTGLGTSTVEPIPFLIEWAVDSLHPSIDSPAGCVLERFEIRHDKPQRVQAVLAMLGVDVTVEKADVCELRAVLATPRGRIHVS